MTFRINANSCKNAMGTVFLLAAAFFVCSTFVSMRSVFADPIAPANTLPQKAGRTSPRATVTNRTNASRTTTSRATVTPTVESRGTVSRGGATRNVTARGNASVRNVAATESRGVTSRSQAANNTRNNRAVRARTATTTSRVSAAGSVMPGARASTSYSYLASSLYTGSYSNIIDSSTGLISADAYSNCMESYYTCMDEICTARSDTKGRCSCAGRATNFLEAETKLEEANEELIKLSGQLSLLVATKGKGDSLSAAFSLTDAEKVMNCVSWKETVDKYGDTSTEAINWCYVHNIFGSEGGKVTSCTKPSYCSSNDFGFDIKDIDGSSSDILAQLKAWADAKDLAKQYSSTDNENLVNVWTSVSGVIDGMSGMSGTSATDEASLDKLANKWGYDLFQYAHNNVCGRVLDSCFNGIYEACGTPKSIKEDGTTVRIKCANGATSNCPFNYNSYISVDTDSGDVVLSDRSESNNVTVSSSASCFGYSGTSTTTTTRSGITSTSSDPYATLRGPVADARRSIMQKYLLDSNAACDVYGANLKQTAQNINYQKIAAEQALRQKRLEFKQEEESSRIADAKAAIDNFNECISEIWDCYTQYEDDDTWTTARIKSYCSQASNVPHCYETMICSPLQTQLTAVVDVADKNNCKIYENGTYIYEGSDACRNVVTISEILYGTGADNIANASYALENWTGIGSLNNLSSAALREVCLQRALRTEDDAECNSVNRDCLRGWKKPSKDTGD